jgi:hypothetical protein
MARVEYIGECWLEEDGALSMRLFCTSDGQPASGQFSYPKTDKDYEAMLKHVGGIQPGERKPVAPFGD